MPTAIVLTPQQRRLVEYLVAHPDGASVDDVHAALYDDARTGKGAVTRLVASLVARRVVVVAGDRLRLSAAAARKLAA